MIDILIEVGYGLVLFVLAWEMWRISKAQSSLEEVLDLLEGEVRDVSLELDRIITEVEARMWRERIRVLQSESERINS